MSVVGLVPVVSGEALESVAVVPVEASFAPAAVVETTVGVTLASVAVDTLASEAVDVSSSGVSEVSGVTSAVTVDNVVAVSPKAAAEVAVSG